MGKKRRERVTSRLAYLILEVFTACERGALSTASVAPSETKELAGGTLRLGLLSCNAHMIDVGKLRNTSSRYKLRSTRIHTHRRPCIVRRSVGRSSFHDEVQRRKKQYKEPCRCQLTWQWNTSLGAILIHLSGHAHAHAHARTSIKRITRSKFREDKWHAAG